MLGKNFTLLYPLRVLRRKSNMVYFNSLNNLLEKFQIFTLDRHWAQVLLGGSICGDRHTRLRVCGSDV